MNACLRKYCLTAGYVFKLLNFVDQLKKKYIILFVQQLIYSPVFVPFFYVEEMVLTNITNGVIFSYTKNEKKTAGQVTCLTTTVWAINVVLSRSIPLELSRSIPFY